MIRLRLWSFETGGLENDPAKAVFGLSVFCARFRGYQHHLPLLSDDYGNRSGAINNRRRARLGINSSRRPRRQT